MKISNKIEFYELSIISYLPENKHCAFDKKYHTMSDEEYKKEWEKSTGCKLNLKENK